MARVAGRSCSTFFGVKAVDSTARRCRCSSPWRLNSGATCTAVAGDSPLATMSSANDRGESRRSARVARLASHARTTAIGVPARSMPSAHQCWRAQRWSSAARVAEERARVELGRSVPSVRHAGSLTGGGNRRSHRGARPPLRWTAPTRPGTIARQNPHGGRLHRPGPLLEEARDADRLPGDGDARGPLRGGRRTPADAGALEPLEPELLVGLRGERAAVRGSLPPQRFNRAGRHRRRPRHAGRRRRGGHRDRRGARSRGARPPRAGGPVGTRRHDCIAPRTAADPPATLAAHPPVAVPDPASGRRARPQPRLRRRRAEAAPRPLPTSESAARRAHPRLPARRSLPQRQQAQRGAAPAAPAGPPRLGLRRARIAGSPRTRRTGTSWSTPSG